MTDDRYEKSQHSPCPDCDGDGCRTCNNEGVVPYRPPPDKED